MTKPAAYHMVKRKLQITDPRLLAEILTAGQYMTLALCGGDEPYLVTLSYGFHRDRNCLYFHCARRGLKLDLIRENSRVCGTVIDDRGYRTGHCDHRFRSVVFWGNARRIRDPEEIRQAYTVMMNQLETDPAPVKKRLLKGDFDLRRACLFCIEIDRITGKQSGAEPGAGKVK